MTQRPRTTACIAGLGAILFIGVGCASNGNNGLAGTWRADENIRTRDPDVGRFQFGAVTFAEDGTYTAHMIYGERQLGESGKWRTSGNRLDLPVSDRSYRYNLDGDALRLTDFETNTTLVLNRYH